MEQPDLSTQLSALASTLEKSHPQALPLLRRARLRIQAQEEALYGIQQELGIEELDRMRLKNAAYKAQLLMEQALQAIRDGQKSVMEIGLDMAGHINLMAGHGDPDDLNKSGQSIRHVDLREKPPRKKKANA